MTKAVWGAGARLGLVASLLLATVSCGDMVRQGQASSYLIVTTLEAASGADPSTFGGVLASDVITVVEDVPTVFEDLGRVTLALGMKDPGSVTAPTSPTSANYITVNRYRVRYIRADGRNTEGVDVPYGFEGAFTATVSETLTVPFTLVRVQAKAEAPLKALAVNGSAISTIAEITFFGHDQTGRSVSVEARIGVNFANWGDPDS